MKINKIKNFKIHFKIDNFESLLEYEIVCRRCRCCWRCWNAEIHVFLFWFAVDGREHMFSSIESETIDQRERSKYNSCRCNRCIQRRRRWRRGRREKRRMRDNSRSSRSRTGDKTIEATCASIKCDVRKCACITDRMRSKRMKEMKTQTTREIFFIFSRFELVRAFAHATIKSHECARECSSRSSVRIFWPSEKLLQKLICTMSHHLLFLSLPIEAHIRWINLSESRFQCITMRPNSVYLWDHCQTNWTTEQFEFFIPRRLMFASIRFLLLLDVFAPQPENHSNITNGKRNESSFHGVQNELLGDQAINFVS